MLTLATPLALLLLIPWAIAVWRLYRRAPRTGVLFAPMQRLPEKTAGWRVSLARLIPPIFLLGFLLGKLFLLFYSSIVRIQSFEAQNNMHQPQPEFECLVFLYLCCIR